MNQAVETDKAYRCYLGLGGNLTNELGTPSEHIHHAVSALTSHPKTSHVRVSSLYASKPMGPQDQPDFINAVVEVDTTLDPYQLLNLCQQLEQDAQRVRVRHWGERSLDVDVLLYADQTINSDVLTVPHPGIMERNFVLVPLKELNPSLSINGVSILDVPKSQDWDGLEKLSQ